MSEEVKEEKSWFEKSLEEFDDIDDEGHVSGEEDEEEEMKKEIDEQAVAKSSRRKKRHLSAESTGVVYPVDVWGQIARFISPETIGTFACLCKGSNSVVNTVQFWKVLHLRFYRDREDLSLPDHLTLNSLDCIHGLRARVIQLLHHVYPPLVARVQTSIPFEDQPHCLVGQRCILAWHRQVCNKWKFYFKFCKSDKIDTSSNKQRKITSRYFDKWHQDLFYNPDNNCTVLEATSQAFVKLPIVMGLILNRVYLNVSSASMLHQKLKLVLDTSYKPTTVKNQGSMLELVLDPVLEARVYPWWDPKYRESHEHLQLTNENHWA